MLRLSAHVLAVGEPVHVSLALVISVYPTKCFPTDG